MTSNEHEIVTKRLDRLASHYERMSGLFMPDDIRGPMMAQAAKDMREVLQAAAATSERNEETK